MEGFYALGGEDKRLTLRGRRLGRGRLAFGVGEAQAACVGLDLVELLRVLDQGRIAAGAHVGHDVGHDPVDILVDVPIAPEESREFLFETRRRGVESKAAARLISRKRSTHWPIRSRLGLERGAIDDEARGDVGDVLDLDQAVLLERAARIDEVDDAMAEAKRRRQLHGARQLHALGLHAARGEVAARHLGILGGDAHVAPAPGIVAARHLDRLGHGQPALADTEIDRRVDLGIVELHQHVGAGDAEVRRAKGHEGRHVEGAHADDVEVGVVGGEAELARLGIGEGCFGLDAGAREQRRRFLEDAALGQRQNELLVGFARHDRRLQ